MPTIFVWNGLRFFFYSNEGSEPPHVHVHVRGAGCEAQVWLSDLSVARNYGFADRQMVDILRQITVNRTGSRTLGERILDADLDIAEAVCARVTQTHVVVTLADGREISTPLEWYPSLRSAPMATRQKLEVSRFGVHWPDLDEDLSVEGMLKGIRPAGSPR